MDEISIYRVRKSFWDIKSQKGAFFTLSAAVKRAKEKGLNVYNAKGKKIFTGGKIMNSPYKGKFKVSQEFKGAVHDGLDLVGLDSKKIYSTTDGVVEFAGWENPKNKKQGFGLYVRLKKTGSVDRYFFGHLSEINVIVGQTVKKGALLGTEGSTGYSTGSHCHYCVRGNGSKSLIRNINEISGIPNRLGTFAQSVSAEEREKEKKNITQLAREVLAGKWGNGITRKKKLIAAGYDYAAVQKEVNRITQKEEKPLKKTNTAIAKEVLSGKWGNGEERKKRLTAAGYDYKTVQALVNKIAK